MNVRLPTLQDAATLGGPLPPQWHPHTERVIELPIPLAREGSGSTVEASMGDKAFTLDSLNGVYDNYYPDASLLCLLRDLKVLTEENAR